ncbi:MAG: alanine racemase [Opitutales bacterium]
MLEAPTNVSRTWVEIDLGALERNVGRVRAALPPWVAYISVVKADAYGHGQNPLAAHLMQGGADAFAVATLEEAIALRELGAGWPILMLSPIAPFEDALLLEHDLVATLSSPDEAQRWSALGRSTGKPVRVHLKVDTGMGRLGVWHEERQTLRALAQTPGLRIEGAYTHFASADQDHAFAATQRARFLAAWAETGLSAKGRVIHADNSAGLDTFAAEGPFNAVRVGLRQFGLGTVPGSVLARVALDPVLSWHARLALVKRLPAGTGISYGQTHRLARDSRVGVLPVGYGDGLPVAASNQGAYVLVGGIPCPVLGRITMDQTIIDVTNAPEAQPGSTATLIGHQGQARLTVDEWSQWANTIPWSIYCGISRRVSRWYRRNRQ